jgi:hypothetical protein
MAGSPCSAGLRLLEELLRRGVELLAHPRRHAYHAFGVCGPWKKLVFSMQAL